MACGTHRFAVRASSVAYCTAASSIGISVEAQARLTALDAVSTGLNVVLAARVAMPPKMVKMRH